MTDTAALARRLDDAAKSGIATVQPSLEQSLTIEDAYDVQRAGARLRLLRGDPLVGVKLGFTSKAKAAQMGVSDVIIGRITETMRIEEGGKVDVGPLIHPRIEPEVAFRLGAALDPHDPTADPLAVVSAVAPALEIIDSRYRDFRFSLPDVVADNTSAAGFVVGPWRPLADAPDLGNVGVVLSIDGVIAETGSTAAILGHPLRALAAVKRMARAYDLPLPAGSVVLAGAATAAVPLLPGTSVTASVTGLGRVGIAAFDGGGHG